MVISIIALLMAIIVPVLGKAKRKALAITGMSNKRQITMALEQYAFDCERYPLSVATLGQSSSWHWHDPTKLAGMFARTGGLHRSVGEYLNTYITDADIMYCPSAPKEYKYLQEAWDSGDDWDNPDIDIPGRPDPAGGTYCFFWEYTGYLGGPRLTFEGPRTPAAGGSQSKLLVTDYFVYNSWRTQEAYSSSVRFRGAEVVPETLYLPSVWASAADPNAPVPEVKLQAGYTDGHVETYSTSEAIGMEVIMKRDSLTPYTPGVGPGTFYLPEGALH